MDHKKNRSDANIRLVISTGIIHVDEDFSLVQQEGIRRFANPHCLHLKIKEKQGISGDSKKSTKTLAFSTEYLGSSNLFQESTLPHLPCSSIQS